MIEVGRSWCAAYDEGMAGHQHHADFAAFPVARPRRLRRSPALRDLVAESHVAVTDLIAPLFVRDGIDEPRQIVSLPGVVQHTRESLRKEVAELAGLGVRAVILFGIPAVKDDVGSGAFDPNGIV
jgi:porphobilinogen synthase